MVDIQVKFNGIEEFESNREKINYHLKNCFHDQAFYIEVAINEAVNNAFKHGNQNCNKKAVFIRFKVLRKSRLIIRIKDEGSGFNANNMLKKINIEYDNFIENKLFEETGRGLIIIKNSMDYMIFNDKGNELLIMKRINKICRDYINNTQQDILYT